MKEEQEKGTPDTAREDGGLLAGAARDAAPDSGTGGVPSAGGGGHSRRGGRLTGILALLGLLLALAAGAGAYWTWHELQRMQARTAAAQARIEDRLRELDTGIKLAGERLRTRLDDRTSALQSRVDALAESTRHLEQVAGRGEAGWALAEARYLLLVANQRVLLAGDVDGAEQALEAADRRLKTLGDPRYLPVRQRIAADLGALKGVARPDIPGIALELGQMVETAGKLPLAAAAGAEVPESAGTSTWQRLAHGMWQAVRRLIVIRRVSGAPGAIAAPADPALLHQNLQLVLETARLAALRHDTANFRAGVRSAQEWLRAHFDRSAPAVRSMLDSLGKLMDQDLSPRYPDLSRSLELLRSLAPGPVAPPAASGADSG